MLTAICGSACRTYESAISSVPAHTGSMGCRARPLAQLTVAAPYNVPFVTLLANGHPVILLLDTGAQHSVLTPSAAERVGARVRVDFQGQIHAVAGFLPSGQVELQSFSADGLIIPWRRLLVAPVTIAKPLGIDLDGLLGADVLGSFDMDLDLPRHRLAFYQKSLCSSATLPWHEPYTEIRAGLSHGEHLFFPIELDDSSIMGVIDTGAQRSILAEATALALGTTRATLEQDQMITTRDAAGNLLRSYIHRFSKLTVGSETIYDPALIVANINLVDANIVLGVDFLRSRRVWFSYGSRKIFLSTS